MLVLMTEPQPQIHVIAGPNGAGKTTFARDFLPRYAECLHFVNPDLIAAGLSPFAPELAAVAAGRLVLTQIRQFAEQRVTFAFETTLSGRTYQPLLQQFRQQGYSVHLYFLWLPDVQLSLDRIADRVRHGGHAVPEEDVRRRFQRSIRNFLSIYRSLADSWIIFDNSGRPPREVASERAGELAIIDAEAFRRLSEVAGPP